MLEGPHEFLKTTPIGTRVVVRYRIDGGQTDALGYLRERTVDSCVVETKRGLIAIALRDVALAKAVPPPPERRAPRHSEQPG